MVWAKSSAKKHRSWMTNLFVLPLTLSIVGLFFVFEASSVRSITERGDAFYFLKLQAVWLFLGLTVMFFFSRFDYHRLYFFSFPSMFLALVSLMIVLIPGIGSQVGGARRWIDIGPVSFQPTELAKFSVVIYLSSWFVNYEKKRFFTFLSLLGVLIFLIILQPDMGTAIIIFALSIIVYYLAGVETYYLLFLIPAAIAGFFVLVKISPYRFKRLLAFINPALDPQGISYHINQILISLSNGGLFGQGLGASRQKYLFLPEAHTDSIFAIIAEEIGFLGSFILIATFIYLILTIFKVIERAPDRFARLLAGGIFAYFCLQIIINLAGMTNLLPLTGVPLPFISYGGSNMLVSYALIGILLNISKKVKKT